MEKTLNWFLLIAVFYLSGIVACSSEDIALVKVTTEGTEELIVDPRITELRFTKDKTKEVLGLEKLSKLRKMTFNMMSFIEDYSFIERNKNIEELIFWRCNLNDIDFIKALPKLKILVIQGCKINFEGIDLSVNQYLEYLEISNSSLTSIPRIANVSNNLEYINLAYNKIVNLDPHLLKNINTIPYKVFTGNPIKEEIAGDQSLLFGEDLFEVLPKKYQKYIR